MGQKTNLNSISPKYWILNSKFQNYIMEYIQIFQRWVHDDWEKIYLDNIDYNSLDSAAIELCNKIVDGRNQNDNGKT